MTLHGGYALPAGTSLEELDMGGGSVLSLVVTGEQSDGRVLVLSGVVHEGGPPLHVHDDEDEVVVVLEGELAYRVGQDEGVLTPGGVLWFPRAVPHAVAQTGTGPVRFLTVVTPAGLEDLFRAQRDLIAATPPGRSLDPAQLAALEQAATRRVVGPPIG